MAQRTKNYLGTIEVDLGGIQYEVGIREEKKGTYRGMWNCPVCQVTEAATALRPTTAAALELAKLELSDHHEELHRVHQVLAPTESESTLAVHSA